MKADIQKLEQILFSASTRRVVIPKYQRPYSWGSKNIEEKIYTRAEDLAKKSYEIWK